jgi:tetratricopeptide (TPR) repeat protein/HAMP domain-containing protein
MIKLVGVSLVAILLVIGFVGNLTLTHSEKEYDNKRKIEINILKKNIIDQKYSELPETIEYILTKPVSDDIFETNVSVAYAKTNETISKNQILEGIEKKRMLLLGETIAKVMKENGRSRKKDSPTPEELSSAFELFKNTRVYRNLLREYQSDLFRLYRQAGERFIHYDFIENNTRYEVGYSYIDYRKLIHGDALSIIYILLLTGLSVLIIFPKFFHSSLVKPLNNLLDGVKKVNDGDFDIQVPIKIQDEIGYLAGSFNSMVTSIKEARKELEDYAENLEEKVEVRTREVQEKMKEVHKLKVQQDGDYFLTSLLAKPLFFNANKSKFISTEFLIRQKKKFEFRNKTADLGGDICITGNLRFGTPENNRRYTMAINGDAMGKSMQGAGGSLVMGVVMNAIMSRSASNKKVLGITPEQWLLDVHKEVDSVFKSFDGTMVISATIVLIDEVSGDMFYINAEHPASILYRDGKAEFIEKELLLRKFGSESEFDCEVKKFKLEPGDILILGSDGRDDIDLTPDANVRTINEDETVILGIVEKADADCKEMERILESMGTITDDLSFLKISFQSDTNEEDLQSLGNTDFNKENKQAEIEINDADPDPDPDKLDLTVIYQQSKQLYHEGNISKALEILTNAYASDQSNQKLNKLLGLISFKGKDYAKAVEVLDTYLKEDPDTEEILYYLSLSQKRMGNYLSSLEVSQRVYELDPDNLNNMINLADLHRLTGNYEKAREFSNLVLEIDSENKNARKILNHIGG